MCRSVMKYIFLCLFPVLGFFAGVVSAKDIVITNAGGECISFPGYMKSISEPIAKETSRIINKGSIPSEITCERGVLEELRRYCELLPNAARDKYGNRPVQSKINVHTIFVNGLVESEMSRLLPGRNPRGNAMLYQLCDAAFELEIQSLQNLFSFEIARRIFPSVSKKFNSKKLSHTKHKAVLRNDHSEDRLAFTIEEVLLLEERNISKYSKLKTVDGKMNMKNIKNIEKYIRLLMQNIKEELTIADYIGLYGQRKCWECGKIDLSGKGLTSMDGLELIIALESIDQLDLSNNQITVLPDKYREFAEALAEGNPIRATDPALFSKDVVPLSESRGFEAQSTEEDSRTVIDLNLLNVDIAS